MRYKSGKHYQGKRVGAFVNRWRKPGQIYWEPFCGACGALRHVDAGVGPVYASDYCKPIIELQRKVQGGWVPPRNEISDDDYQRYQNGWGSPEMRALVGFGHSIHGIWFSNHQRGSDVPRQASESLLRYAKTIPSETIFLSGDYAQVGRVLNPYDAFVYADPPYRGYAMFWGRESGFDSDAFFAWAIGMSDRGNDVVISEFTAPRGFVKVKQIKNPNRKKRTVRSGTYSIGAVDEWLFVVDGSELYHRWRKEG